MTTGTQSSSSSSRSTSLADMWSGIQSAASKNPATEKLLDAAKGYIGAQASKAMSSVGEKAGGVTQKLTDFSEGKSDDTGLFGKGAQKIAEGEKPGTAMVKAGGEQLKEKVK